MDGASDLGSPHAGATAFGADPHVFVATPCYGGMVTQAYTQSLLGLCVDAATLPMNVSLAMLGQDALITRSRNTLVARFLESRASHLLFVDADIGFSTADVVRLVTARRGVIGAMYPIRAHRWGPDALTRIRAGEPATSACLDYVGEPLGPPGPDGIAPARYAGTGFLMIAREAILDLAAAYPETRCRHAHVAGGDPIDTYALFDCLIEPGTRNYLSEDYGFCERWRRIGGTIWLDTTIRLSHNGMAEFRGDPAARAEIVRMA